MSEAPTREGIENWARTQAPINPKELAKALREGSLLLQLLGHLVRLNDEAGTFMLGMDLISDEGRLNAIKQQGVLQGRNLPVEDIISLILEGHEDEHGTDHDN